MKYILCEITSLSQTEFIQIILFATLASSAILLLLQVALFKNGGASKNPSPSRSASQTSNVLAQEGSIVKEELATFRREIDELLSEYINSDDQVELYKSSLKQVYATVAINAAKKAADMYEIYNTRLSNKLQSSINKLDTISKQLNAKEDALRTVIQEELRNELDSLLLVNDAPGDDLHPKGTTQAA